MFSKIGESWDDAYIGSLHGREENFIEKVKKYKKVGLLTDKNWTPYNIAKELEKNELSNFLLDGIWSCHRRVRETPSSSGR